uniref:Uncharacterized protein n=1 Tax=Leersia perrieri TaxID=77586 RepID=A0A0D9W7D3_9ORYZ
MVGNHRHRVLTSQTYVHGAHEHDHTTIYTRPTTLVRTQSTITHTVTHLVVVQRCRTRRFQPFRAFQTSAWSGSSSLPLVLLSLLAISNAQAPSPVYDTDGHELIADQGYYVLPAAQAGGGLTLAHDVFPCQLLVAQQTGDRLNLPVYFTAWGGASDRTASRPTSASRFKIATTCVQTTKWHVSGERQVVTGPVAWPPSGREDAFRVEKSGAGAYKLVSCTDSCRDMGLTRHRKLDFLEVSQQAHVVVKGPARATLTWRESSACSRIETGGIERVFSAKKGERLVKALQCCLYTTGGPIGYRRDALRLHQKDRLLQGQVGPGNDVVRVPYRQIAKVRRSENTDKPHEKYILISSLHRDGFWFMGFVSYQRSCKQAPSYY